MNSKEKILSMVKEGNISVEECLELIIAIIFILATPISNPTITTPRRILHEQFYRHEYLQMH